MAFFLRKYNDMSIGKKRLSIRLDENFVILNVSSPKPKRFL